MQIKEGFYAHTMFQFLIGRLDTEEEGLQGREGVRFQFLIGRLDTRMEPGRSMPLILFQFLIGRLDTGIAQPRHLSDSVRFNSS